VTVILATTTIWGPITCCSEFARQRRQQ